MGAIFTNIAEIFAKSGWAQIFFTEGGWKYAVMLAVACVLPVWSGRLWCCLPSVWQFSVRLPM